MHAGGVKGIIGIHGEELRKGQDWVAGLGALQGCITIHHKLDRYSMGSVSISQLPVGRGVTTQRCIHISVKSDFVQRVFSPLALYLRSVY